VFERPLSDLSLTLLVNPYYVCGAGVLAEPQAVFERPLSDLSLTLLVNPYYVCVVQVCWQSPKLSLRDLSVRLPSPLL
jgi:hypothetical protein